MHGKFTANIISILKSITAREIDENEHGNLF